jgi:hypothetical protein
MAGLEDDSPPPAPSEQSTGKRRSDDIAASGDGGDDGGGMGDEDGAGGDRSWAPLNSSHRRRRDLVHALAPVRRVYVQQVCKERSVDM